MGLNTDGHKVRAQREKEDRYNIRVLDRAIVVLSVLSDGRLHTLTELSETARLNSSTAFRILATLNYHRYVERDEASGAYKLGLACLELARAYGQANDLRQIALPELEVLRDHTKETVHLAVMDAGEVVYLEKLPGLHAIGIMTSRVGRRSPAYCTGLGKVFLAHSNPALIQELYATTAFQGFTSTTIQSMEELLHQLQEVRDRGYALDRGEHEAEVRCVAAPVFDIDGQVVAAISVSGPANRMEPLEQNAEVIQWTMDSAQAISTRLGYHPPGERVSQK